jgi:methylenetetrahydrofolate dehydrogenase (NADP+)/methenyltetrahydrofolate cyclohydrolase
MSESFTQRVLDGKALSATIRAEIALVAAERKAAGLRPPGLGVILIGDHPASLSYVTAKTRACREVGFHAVQHSLPANVTEAEVIRYVRAYNDDPAIHGILVQLPLPEQVREEAIIEAISPLKDVDGFHPMNAGLLARGTPRFVPCTPLGVVELLKRAGIETRGKHVVIIGRSNIVGRPLAALLSLRGPGGDATVTVAHSLTKNLAEIARSADILVAAIGRPRFVTAEMIRPGAVVIDVGINRIDDPTAPKGTRIVGDVDAAALREFASAYTPVPGGVGPMTIAMLLRNTLESAQRSE